MTRPERDKIIKEIQRLKTLSLGELTRLKFVPEQELREALALAEEEVAYKKEIQRVENETRKLREQFRESLPPLFGDFEG